MRIKPSDLCTLQGYEASLRSICGNMLNHEAFFQILVVISAIMWHLAGMSSSCLYACIVFLRDLEAREPCVLSKCLLNE